MAVVITGSKSKKKIQKKSLGRKLWGHFHWREQQGNAVLISVSSLDPYGPYGSFLRSIHLQEELSFIAPETKDQMAKQLMRSVTMRV